MNQNEAIQLFNNLAQDFMEQFSAPTKFGCVLLARGIPLWLLPKSGIERVAGPWDEANSKVASFLREWADRIEGV